jgi:hypothetical protein
MIIGGERVCYYQLVNKPRKRTADHKIDIRSALNMSILSQEERGLSGKKTGVNVNR